MAEKDTKTSGTKSSRSKGGTGSKSKGGSKSEPELAEAPSHKSRGQVEAFSALSGRLAAGEMVVPPHFLRGQARRLHVRSTLREDHQTRIEERSAGAEVKFAKLSSSLFKFFRGTALLFYRDMAGSDAHMPTVLVLGDVHPENFGVMPDAEGVPIFGVNDFDETIYAPFTWDIKRGAVGFWVAADEVGGFSRKKRTKIVKRFVTGYLDRMAMYAERATEKSDVMRADNAPKVIRRLFEEAWEDRAEWLADYLNENRTGFRADDEELQPISSQIPTFQKAIDDLRSRKGFDVPKRAGEMKVKDVCIRHGQGTASLGLPRYYVLIEGPTKDGTDDIIIEFKRARRSALEGLTPPSEFDAGSKANRIAHGQQVQLAHGDTFYGAVEIDGESFMSRERAPFRDDIDLDDLSYGTWKDYAEVCGAVLAQAHALSDDLGQLDYDVEPSIVAASQPQPLFVDDILRVTKEIADRLKADHKAFVEDFKDGAFDNIDMVYR